MLRYERYVRISNSFFTFKTTNARTRTCRRDCKKKGERPSPGTIYPALKNLREMGFISAEEKEGKIIVYSLTQRGKNALTIAKRRFVKTFLGVFP